MNREMEIIWFKLYDDLLAYYGLHPTGSVVDGLRIGELNKFEDFLRETVFKREGNSNV
jgi:hypothetical protein